MTSAKEISPPNREMISSPIDVPICIDLDGTLIQTDSLVECISLFLKQNPLGIFLIFLWILRGKSHFKWQLARKTKIDYAALPYNKKLISFLNKEYSKNRSVVLVTGANKIIAEGVAQHLRIFDKVYASNASINLVGKNKAVLLTTIYGKQKFDYCGDSKSDLKVWKFANRAIVVNGTRKVAKKVRTTCSNPHIVSLRRSKFRSLIKILRPHQWSKNFLVFFPMILGNIINIETVFNSFLAFVAFSLVASSGYVFNDLLDLNSDRKHHDKRRRPFASGDLSVLVGLALIPALFALSVSVSLNLPIGFLGMIIAYFILTISYSTKFKRVEIADVILLACFYTMRIFSGGIASGVDASVWLITFSSFFFLNLALVKRSAELRKKIDIGGKATLSRGYRLDDQPQLSMLGSVSGFISIVVLAMYVNSDVVRNLYKHPEYLWVMCVVLMYWISRYWLLTNRGLMSSDPVLFALKDRASWVSALIVGVSWIFARGF
ncbi:MAG: UbiA family prenyltransferase [Bdellovibrionota bacterium]